MKINLIFFFLAMNLSCNKKEKKQQYHNEDGLLIEKIDSTNLNENKYNTDNVIYTVNKPLPFEYSYEKNADEWAASVPENLITSHPNTVTKLILEVANGNPVAKYIPDYNPTVIRYKYPSETSANATGLIENEENIWMHPPLQSLFRILELNPFPYVKFPLDIGAKWEWEPKIGDNWSDERWKSWSGTISNNTNYEVSNYQKENTAFDELDCDVIIAKANSEIGSTSLVAYFNEIYGLAKLNYINIDGSMLKLILTDFE